MSLLDFFKKEKSVTLSNSKEIIKLNNGFNKEDIVINNKKFHIQYDVLNLDSASNAERH